MDERSARKPFFSKLFTVIFAQVLVTDIVKYYSMYNELEVVDTGATPRCYLKFALGLCVPMVLICAKSARRSFPLNLILVIADLMINRVMGTYLFSSHVTLAPKSLAVLPVIIVFLLTEHTPLRISTVGRALSVSTLASLIIAGTTGYFLLPMQFAIGYTMCMIVSSALLLGILQLMIHYNKLDPFSSEYILGLVLCFVGVIELAFQLVKKVFTAENALSSKSY